MPENLEPGDEATGDGPTTFTQTETIYAAGRCATIRGTGRPAPVGLVRAFDGPRAVPFLGPLTPDTPASALRKNVAREGVLCDGRRGRRWRPRPVTTRDVRAVVRDDILSQVHRDVYSQIEKAPERAEEQCVDRLAVALVRARHREPKA